MEHTLHVAEGGQSCVEVNSHGRQALSWVVHGRERLFIGPKAAFAPEEPGMAAGP